MVFIILRHWIAFFVPAFYRKIQVKNIHHALADGPVIIAMNHPNAFTDPILFQLQALPHRLSFLARGDAFRPGIITYFLESIGIVPIYRIQDGGKEGLKKNDETYQRVNRRLSKGGKVIVFAEGLCVQERRLRPLKKGVARMVFGAYEALRDDRLRVVPVCVNYSKPHKFGSTAFYNVGEPLFVKDFYADYQLNPARTNNAFLQVLEPRMRELLTHIDDPANDEFVEQVEVLLKAQKIKDLGLDPHSLEDDFTALKEITAAINRAGAEQSEQLALLRNETAAYFSMLEAAGLRDWLFEPLQSGKLLGARAVTGLVALLLFFPVFVAGIAGNYLPFWSADFITRKTVQVKEFYSSIVIGVAMVTFLCMYVIWYFLFAAILPERIWPFSVLLLTGLSAGFLLWYVPLFKKTRGIIRVLLNPLKARQIRENRKKLLKQINKILYAEIQTPAR